MASHGRTWYKETPVCMILAAMDTRAKGTWPNAFTLFRLSPHLTQECPATSIILHLGMDMGMGYALAIGTRVEVLKEPFVRIGAGLIGRGIVRWNQTGAATELWSGWGGLDRSSFVKSQRFIFCAWDASRTLG
jgi:hypothetical protein